MCHVTKYSTICGVFRGGYNGVCQGLLSVAILKAEYTLGTRLVAVKVAPLTARELVSKSLKVLLKRNFPM